ncbi:MAG: flavin reductase family protein [Pseudomonadota bacterium]
MTMHTTKHAVAFSPDAQNTKLLRNALGQFATGVTVVTAASRDGPVGITVNSFSSVSLDPPLVLWSISKGSRRYQYFEGAEHYAIHVLGAHQSDLCHGFSKSAHVLRDLPHGVNENGVPVIDACLARFECVRVAGHHGGDHLIVVGQVVQAEVRGGDALAFFAGEFRHVAHKSDG